MGYPYSENLSVDRILEYISLYVSPNWFNSIFDLAKQANAARGFTDHDFRQWQNLSIWLYRTIYASPSSILSILSSLQNQIDKWLLLEVEDEEFEDWIDELSILSEGLKVARTFFFDNFMNYDFKQWMRETEKRPYNDIEWRENTIEIVNTFRKYADQMAIRLRAVQIDLVGIPYLRSM